MSCMKDKINLLSDLGTQVKTLRIVSKTKTTEIAHLSGRSRDVLNRLERGADVSVSSLLDILRAMNLCLAIVPAGMPSLDEMQKRFGDDDDARPA